MKKMTNQGMAFTWFVVGVLLLTAPFLYLLIAERDIIFQTKENTISVFGVVLLIGLLACLKNTIKKLWQILLPPLFSSIVGLVVVIFLHAFLQYLQTVLIVSLIGSAISWIPFRLSKVFETHSKDPTTGKLLKTPAMSGKEAFEEIFAFEFFVK